jgi:3-dehydroquinate dehydratase/shikimate dehydrogenase
MAALRGAPYVDVEFKASPYFFAGEPLRHGRADRRTPHRPSGLAALHVHKRGARAFRCADQHEVPISTKIILSYHDFKQTPDAAVLNKLVSSLHPRTAMMPAPAQGDSVFLCVSVG